LSNEEVATLLRRLRGYVVKAITYILIAIGCVAAAIWVAVTFKEEDLRFFFYWLTPVLYTAALFGYIVKETRSLWRVRTFWIVLGFSFLVHVGVFAYVFGWVMSSMSVQRVRWCFTALGVEGAGIFLVLGWALEKFGHRKRSGRHSVPKQRDVSVSEQ
jgi:hypothetical protein